jgi:hypothetical protein
MAKPYGRGHLMANILVDKMMALLYLVFIDFS